MKHSYLTALILIAVLPLIALSALPVQQAPDGTYFTQLGLPEDEGGFAGDPFIGIVKAFAGRDDGPRNAVVIAHELLHTLGASDKYNPQSLAPVFPEGYAEPDRQPRHPQRLAEISFLRKDQHDLGMTGAKHLQALTPDRGHRHRTEHDKREIPIPLRRQ